MLIIFFKDYLQLASRTNLLPVGSPSAFKVKGPGFKSHEIQLRPHKVNYIVWVSTTNIIDVVIVMC